MMYHAARAETSTWRMAATTIVPHRAKGCSLLNCILLSGGIQFFETGEHSVLNKFPGEVKDQLQYYVYRLIDPRDGETFYVGRGNGDRVFCHVREELGNAEDLPNYKLQCIREIRNAGLEVGHVIHRHGMDDKTAREVEAALIDAYPGAANLVTGEDSNERGVMHVQEIIERYKAEEVVFEHKAIVITVNRSAAQRNLYDAVRFAWVVDPRKAEQAEIVVAVVRGLIRGVFVADKGSWVEATVENFPGRDAVPGRFGFTGRDVDPKISAKYCGRRLPDSMRKRGAANPIRYNYISSATPDRDRPAGLFTH